MKIQRQMPPRIVLPIAFHFEIARALFEMADYIKSFLELRLGANDAHQVLHAIL